MPLKIVALTNQEELTTNKHVIAANLPNREAKKKLSNPVNPTIRIAVAPPLPSLTRGISEEILSGSKKENFNGATTVQNSLAIEFLLKNGDFVVVTKSALGELKIQGV